VGLQPSVVKAALVQMLAEGDSVSHAARRLAEALGVSRNALYDLAREAEAKLLASERHWSRARKALANGCWAPYTEYTVGISDQIELLEANQRHAAFGLEVPITNA
jgi:hypothetical protein